MRAVVSVYMPNVDAAKWRQSEHGALATTLDA
jgi:hypothetical protein